MPRTVLPLVAVLWSAVLAGAQEAAPESAPAPAAAEPAPAAVAQLRHCIGVWEVTTEFIAPDGSVARTVAGSYTFEWVVPDRVVRGVATMPELDQTSALLFYVRPRTRELEMVSVGADGQLWRMSGPDDGETRTTPPTPMPDGTTLMLRFTRYDVEPDRFRSRMELSNDAGETWRLGNRQAFRRAGG